MVKMYNGCSTKGHDGTKPMHQVPYHPISCLHRSLKSCGGYSVRILRSRWESKICARNERTIARPKRPVKNALPIVLDVRLAYV
jgi:hypothetical protein